MSRKGRKDVSRVTEQVPHDTLETVPQADREAYVRAWVSVDMLAALAVERRHPRVSLAEWKKLIERDRIRHWKAMLGKGETLHFLREAWRELTAKGGCWESLSEEGRRTLMEEKDRLKATLNGGAP